MGNTQNSNKSKRNLKRCMNKLKKNCRKLSKSSSIPKDDFIIKYNNLNTATINININELDQRRCVFISLIGLYLTWKKVPSFMLYSSLFILPLKRDWIYHPSKYQQEITSCFVSRLSLFQPDCQSIKQFIELLKWKDSQGLVVWMLDEAEKSHNHHANTLIAPFWFHLSAKLKQLTDPITREKYKGITLDSRHWETNYNGDIKVSTILAELYFVTMKFKTMSEILHECNPDSLNIITYYKETEDVLTTDRNEPVCCSIYENDEELAATDNDEDEWIVSPDYDPYDIDTTCFDINGELNT